jgi:hypothetical protein
LTSWNNWPISSSGSSGGYQLGKFQRFQGLYFWQSSFASRETNSLFRISLANILLTSDWYGSPFFLGGLAQPTQHLGVQPDRDELSQLEESKGVKSAFSLQVTFPQCFGPLTSDRSSEILAFTPPISINARALDGSPVRLYSSRQKESV